MSTWTLIDTETTGLYPPIYVVEIAAQKFKDLVPIGEPFQVFLNHEVEIPPDATAIHGYTTEFISEYGISPKWAYAQLRDFVGDDPIVSHYLGFDWNRVLIHELIRLREQMIGIRGFCSWMLSRRVLPEHPTHRLDYLRDHYVLGCSRPHSALGDVEAVTDLLVRIIFPRLVVIGCDTFDRIFKFSNICPILKCKFLIQGFNDEEAARKVEEERKEKRNLKRFFADVESGRYSMPSLILDHDLIEEHPNIKFEGSTFLFTGKMTWGSRPLVTKLIEERGGTVSQSKTITKDIDYFVLGEDNEKGWLSLIEGRKLKKAFLKRIQEPDLVYHIVREEDFIASLNGENVESQISSSVYSLSKTDFGTTIRTKYLE